jgi:ATP-binding cassette, subfamily C (CFTR/MRP), member 1
VYHKADISVIDDALSAVDAHVAQVLFNRCIVEEMVQNQKRSVVLVTNAIQYLNHEAVARIFVINDGRVVEQGSYKELANKKGSLFAKFVAVVNETGIGPGELQEAGVSLDEVDSAEEALNVIQERLSNAKRRSSISVKADTKETPSKQLEMTEEARSVGHIKPEVYLAYARAAGGIYGKSSPLGAMHPILYRLTISRHSVPFLVTGLYAAVECEWFSS